MGNAATKNKHQARVVNCIISSPETNLALLCRHETRSRRILPYCLTVLLPLLLHFVAQLKLGLVDADKAVFSIHLDEFAGDGVDNALTNIGGTIRRAFQVVGRPRKIVGVINGRGIGRNNLD